MPRLDPALHGAGSADGIAALSITQVHLACRRALVAAGIESAATDAAMLVEAATGLSRVAMLSAPDTLVEQSAVDALNAMVARRCAGEPVSRILGWREFYGRPFRVTPDVLDPRADSETLIDAALNWRRALSDRFVPRVLDFGTGSGCLLLTLLAEWPDASGLGIDISATALEVASANANALGTPVADRVTFERHDGLEDLARYDPHGFNVLISNPPYIRRSDVASLDVAVRDFDPHLALDGGPDGLAFYRHIARNALRLVPQGAIFLEIGCDQAASVMQIFSSAIPKNQLQSLEVLLDLGGRTRCVAMQTRGE